MVLNYGSNHCKLAAEPLFQLSKEVKLMNVKDVDTFLTWILLSNVTSMQ